MASETDQLAHDFEEVRKLLARYPQIHAVRTQGEPPATYEIEYQLNSLTRQGDGNVSKSARHRVHINLPFGYPHFPPAVKPLTPLFHPDVDPDAVRIASHWQQNPSLADLILHIGEMICAKSYNLEEPFNQEAADWYSEHADEFPLDELHLEDADLDLETGDLSLEENDLTAGLEGGVSEAAEQAEEDDFALSMEIDTEISGEDLEEDIDEHLKEVQYHIDRNEVVSAGKLLTRLSSSAPEAQRLEKIVSSAISQRDKLLQELEELENEDQFDDAYKIFEKIQKIAPDTPALSDIGQRLRQSQAMLDTFSLPTATAEEQEDQVPAAPAKRKKTAKKKRAGNKSPQKEKPAIQRKSGRPSVELPVRTIIAGLILLLIGIGTVLLHNNSMRKMGELESRWIEIKYQRCRTADQFKEKRIQAEKILVGLKSVYFHWLGKEDLEKEIRDVLDSPDFKKGENGAKDYKGVSLPVPVIEKLEQLDKKNDQAADAAEKKQFVQALSFYQEALAFAAKARSGTLMEPHAEKLNAELDKRIPKINEKITELRAKAGQEEKRKEFRLAEEAYRQSLAFCQAIKDKESNPSETEGADSTGEMWKQCVARLEHAEQLLDTYPEIKSSERQEKIKTLLAYSRLYQELDIARHAYEDGEFVTAINEYEKALRLLEENRSDLNTIYNDAVLKVGRTVVMLNVSLELRKAVDAENRNDLRGSLQHYKKILGLIRSSRVNKDATLNKLEQYIRSKINEQSLKAAKSSNQEWWQKNYQKIFKKKFPSIRPVLLSKPRIYFIKVRNGRLLYTIRCAEKGVTFELNYQYDLANGKWSPYQGKL